MSLWTDDPQPRTHTPPPPREPADPPAPPAPSREPRVPSRWPAAVGGGLVSAIVVSAVLLGTGLAGGNNDQPATTTPANPSPVNISASDNKGDLIRTVYAAASPSVASVRTGQGSGTGFLVDSNGTIVTNAHVVGDNKQVLPSLESGTAPQHAYLGLKTTQPRSGEGALVAETTPGGPSARAGLQQ